MNVVQREGDPTNMEDALARIHELEAELQALRLEDEKPERFSPLHDPECDCSQCREEDRLGYDADFGDRSQYCRHGTFIGSWWGPDYMCPYCESE